MSKRTEQTKDENPHKQLLAEAAAEIRADQIAREKDRPKGVADGTLRLVQNTVGGVALGAVSAVKGPIQGYKQSGPKGIVSGALEGLVAGAAATAIGVGTGVAGFTQGATNTVKKKNSPSDDSRFHVESSRPAELLEPMDGSSTTSSRDLNAPSIKEKYAQERERLYGDLIAEYSAKTTSASMDGLTTPVNKELYDILDVDVSSTPAQIRKAYYRKAQLYHPDRHQDDPEATKKFQMVGNAYQYVAGVCIFNSCRSIYDLITLVSILTYMSFCLEHKNP